MMGYCIDLLNEHFTMPAANKAGALRALQEMWKLDPSVRRGGGDGRTWFSWMNDTSLAAGCCETFEQGMDEWGYPVTVDTEGNVTGISLRYEKLGQEFLMFTAIAPFVAAESWLIVQGEDGDQWRWYFDGTTCIEQPGRVSFG